LKYVGNYLRTVADFSLNVKRMAAERERERDYIMIECLTKWNCR